jgi:hypothetical protein
MIFVKIKLVAGFVGDEMKSVKNAVMGMIKELPGNATMEDIQYHLYVREKVEKGLLEVREGNTYDSGEIKRKMKRWLEK